MLTRLLPSTPKESKTPAHLVVSTLFSFQRSISFSSLFRVVLFELTFITLHCFQLDVNNFFKKFFPCI